MLSPFITTAQRLWLYRPVLERPAWLHTVTFAGDMTSYLVVTDAVGQRGASDSVEFWTKPESLTVLLQYV
ncbi:hypothetical protein BV25DRAFT_1831045, partial [Artomyces pyxidatus]